MKKILLVLILLIYSCQSDDQSQSIKADFEFSSFNISLQDTNSIFSKNLDKNKLIETIGASNLSDTTEWIEEGTLEVITTRIYPNTAKELTIYWDNDNKLKSILLNKPNSKWNANGIKVGMNLNEVVKQNSSDFYFYSFGWDNGGYVYDWNNGTLSDSTNNFRVNLNLNWDTVGNKNIDKFMGDSTKLKSNNPELKKLGLSVYSILVNYQ